MGTVSDYTSRVVGEKIWHPCGEYEYPKNEKPTSAEPSGAYVEKVEAAGISA
jgi:hypothetical protein